MPLTYKVLINDYYLIVKRDYKDEDSYTDEDCYKVINVVSDLEHAQKLFYTLYVQTVLDRNKYSSFLTDHMLVHVNDLVRAVEHTWDVIIPPYVNHSTRDMREFLDRPLLDQFIHFKDKSDQYKAK